MYTLPPKSDNKIDNYRKIEQYLPSLFDKEVNIYSNLANTIGLLKYFIDDINWIGFYLVEKDYLEVGPFAGLPSCTKIPKGLGVCGTAYATGKIQIVSDVTECSNHIICDPESRAEVVLPIVHKGQVMCVLDIDSPYIDRFDNIDIEHLEKIAKIISTFY